MKAIDISLLATVAGGADQQQLRDMARRWCPRTYAANAGARTLTRTMGERCLDEAGLGAYKSQLDQYFK